jgi:hypothetical protein
MFFASSLLASRAGRGWIMWTTSIHRSSWLPVNRFLTRALHASWPNSPTIWPTVILNSRTSVST